MITKDELQEAVEKYKQHGLSKWYLNWFFNKKPEKYYVIIMIIAFFGGFTGSVLNMSHSFVEWFCYILLSLMIPLAFCHIITWLSNKKTAKKRAKYLGIELSEYYYYMKFYKIND